MSIFHLNFSKQNQYLFFCVPFQNFNLARIIYIATSVVLKKDRLYWICGVFCAKKKNLNTKALHICTTYTDRSFNKIRIFTSHVIDWMSRCVAALNAITTLLSHSALCIGCKLTEVSTHDPHMVNKSYQHVKRLLLKCLGQNSVLLLTEFYPTIKYQ